MMQFTSFSAITLGFVLASQGFAHEQVIRARTDLRIPDVPGYVTLKGDFHIHTVFSDGTVWPTVRAEEAWREGLDAIAITDHIEYQPHKADVSTNHNRSFSIARPIGQSLDLLMVKGSEITRSMPPGHLNAIFPQDAQALDVDKWEDAVNAAHKQGAFIFWNHPGWASQLKADGKVRWYDEHTTLLNQGMLHGIEVVNTRNYYPEAHQWALEKGLTMLSNSDIHAPLNLDYHVHAGDHRPITLVFAKERTLKSLKEALFDRRTAVYSGELLIGEERFLRPIFEQSVALNRGQLSLRGKQRVYLQLSNHSDLDYVLERTGTRPEVQFPGKVTLPAGKTVLFEVRGKSDKTEGTPVIQMPYKVTNLLIAPDKPLPVSFEVEIKFTPKG